MHMLPKDVCGYLQYGANALCRVENFTTAVPGFNSLLRGIKLVSIVSQLANGHMVLFKDNLKIDTPLFSEGIAYINCNNIPMTQSVSSLHLQSFEDDDTNYFGSAGQTSGIHEPKRRILSIAWVGCKNRWHITLSHDLLIRHRNLLIFESVAVSRDEFLVHNPWILNTDFFDLQS